MGRHNSSRRGALPTPEIRPDDPTLTRFAGAIPLIAFMTEELGLVSWFRDIVRYRGRRRRYAVHLILFAFVVGALVGVRRMAHLEWLRDDAVLLKWLRLPGWPVRKVFSQALRSLSEAGRIRLEELVAELGFRTLGKVKSLVVDIDPTAIVDHGKGEKSEFGHCGKGRNRRRHYPIVASVAETRAIIAAWYRGGKGLNSAERLGFFQFVAARIRAKLGTRCQLIFRGDSGMHTIELMCWLVQEKIGFVFAFAMRPRVKSALHRGKWTVDPNDPDLEFTAVHWNCAGFPSGLRMIGIRRRDDDPNNPAQGKLLPGCHYYRYQALITDRDWEPRDVWRFYNHRADCERVFRTGKQALGLGNLVGRNYAANAAAFLLRALAFNIDLLFQQAAENRAKAEGRKVRRLGLQWRQFRFYCSPGRLLREHCRWILRVPTNPMLAKVWAFYRPPGPALLT